MTRTLPLVVLFLSILLAAPSFAQEKRQLTHDDYERWKTISDESLSNDGAWAVWREAPDTIGDGRVVVRSTNGRTMHVIERGDSPAFSADGGFLVAMVHPPYDSTRQAKVDGKSGDDLPQDSLIVLNLSNGSRTGWANVASFRMPEDEGAWVAVMLNEMPEDTSKTADDEEEDSEEADGPDHDKTDGTPLVLVHLDSGDSWTFDYARSYRVTDDGGWLVYTAESEDGAADGAFAVNAATGAATTLLQGAGYFRHPVVDEDGAQVAFLSNTGDFDAEQPSFTLYRADLGGGRASAVVSEGHDALPDGWWVSEHEAPGFSKSGERLFFGTAPRPEPEPEDNTPDDEKVPVDVWSWDDDYLMTVQLENRSDELERSYTAVLHLDDGSVVQLATEAVPDVNLVSDGDADTFIGTSNIPYRQDREWDFPWAEDVYAVDAATGERRLILQEVNGSVEPSPDGSMLAWWDREARAWKMTVWGDEPAEHIMTASITSGMDAPVFNLEHDWPYGPNPYGSAGWTEDGSMFVFYDEFDMWAWRISGEDAGDGDLVAVTAPRGRERSVRYRWTRTDADANGIPTDTPQLLSLFNEETKASGFAEWRISRSVSDVRDIVMDDLNFGFEGKADDSGRVLFTRESYEIFPDLWTAASWRDIPNGTRLSDVNPQQDEYTWGSVELVHWTSTDGERLDGLLYKPEGFDPSRQYPMMTYFYETSSDGLHGYHTPAPGRSVINRTFYASRGYLVFVPDIPYKIGYPGESAMNAVMPGVTHLIDQGFVDRDRVGVQGHSWGGYQIAYMVTRTNLFAAAEAGAPVANMVSAYGGIRWETGLSRQFQYERTQSRIGGSIWEKPLRYIENSPIFWLDKVETPLLIMHNDADGHVPWYQGIELFVGLRRLDKPAWFINYNDEPHWPLPYFKRLDWTMRLQQFFDHYLMDAPAPVWLEEGVPAVDKGRTRGLELVEPPTDRTYERR